MEEKLNLPISTVTLKGDVLVLTSEQLIDGKCNLIFSVNKNNVEASRLNDSEITRIISIVFGTDLETFYPTGVTIPQQSTHTGWLQLKFSRVNSLLSQAIAFDLYKDNGYSRLLPISLYGVNSFLEVLDYAHRIARISFDFMKKGKRGDERMTRVVEAVENVFGSSLDDILEMDFRINEGDNLVVVLQTKLKEMDDFLELVDQIDILD